MDKRLFENISTVYQNLRALVEALENETGARICVSIATREEYDEGFFVLSGIDEIMREYGVKDYEILEIPEKNNEYETQKVRFRLFGIKFEGYRMK